MAELSIMDRSGHRTLAFAPDDEQTVAEAKAAFDEVMSQGGMMAFSTKVGGDNEVIRDFDPTADEIVVGPALVGG